jgi:DNA gyrase subunit B
LLLTFFYRNFPEVIERGYLYIAQPPLYAISKGKNLRYAYSDDGKDKIVAEFEGGKKGEVVEVEEPKAEMLDGEVSEATEEAVETAEAGVKPKGNISIQRYKGLGEMNADQLWETTMNPENRTLLQVSSADAEKADEIFTMLMGDEVGPRKKFIQTHAASVKNLDV